MIDHLALRRENEPSLNDVLEEQTRGNPEQKTDARSCPVDYDLIRRVLKEEVRRDDTRKKKWVENMVRGQRAKRRRSFTTGKKHTPAPAADSTIDTSK